MVILSPELDDEASDSVIDRIKGIITDEGGEITEVDDWGLRRLTYEIKDHKDGQYVVVQFKGDTAVLEELERVLGLMDAVLRFLTVRLDED
jgi:small subunit ribosomal protein S6